LKMTVIQIGFYSFLALLLSLVLPSRETKRLTDIPQWLESGKAP
jgi:hypothetical protein